MLLQSLNTTWNEENFEVLKVIHDTLMIVRHPMNAPRIKSSTSLYTIGKYLDLEKYGQQFSESRRRYQDKSIKNVNTGKIVSNSCTYLSNRNFKFSSTIQNW